MPAISQPRPEPAEPAAIEEFHDTSEPAEATPYLKVDLATIWDQRWTILLTILAFMALGAVYLAFADSVFEAESRVVVRFDGSTFDDEYKISTDREFMATQAEIIRSPLVLRAALTEGLRTE